MSPSSFFIFLYWGSALFMLSYFCRHSSSLTTLTLPSAAVSFSNWAVSVAFFSCRRSSLVLSSSFLRETCAHRASERESMHGR
jgi:hypothetical protein